MAEVRSIPLSQPIADYIARLVLATRPGEGGPAERIKWGASPRAVIGMGAAARARAFLEGRMTVGFDDVRAVALPILRHRVILDYQARLDGLGNDRVVEDVIAATRELERDEPRSLAVRLAGG